MSLDECQAKIKRQPYRAMAGGRLCSPGVTLKISAPSSVTIDKVVMSVYHPSNDKSPPRVVQKINFIFDEKDQRSDRPQGIVWAYKGRASDVRGVFRVAFNFDFFDTDGQEFSYICVSEPIVFH